MIDRYTIMGLVVAVFMVLGIGGLLRKFNWLTQEADESLLKLVVRLLMPCFFFNVVVGNDKFMNFLDAWPPPTIGFVSTAIGYLLALFVARLLGPRIGLKSRIAQHTFALCVGTFNYGYIPLPLIDSMFDTATLGTLVVHNLGVEIAIWTIGLLILQGKLDRNSWKRILNPPLIAIVLSLTLNQMGWHDDLPTFITSPIKLLAQATIPMGLIMVGATMADQLALTKNQLLSGWREAAAGVVLRMMILPVIFIFAARYLAIDVELKRVMVVQAAMPCAVFPIVLAKHYGGDTAVALRVVLATSIVAIISIPNVITEGLAFILN
ncbi:AEC family transporter [bacterium AH-315-I18]|nr:AEC family transporter [Phycisphaeraceae bacterium]MBN4061082.1 AEC family transporter [bacterium AH-315-I18]